MTTTDGVNPNQYSRSTDSNQGGGFGKYLALTLILGAAFFTAKALMTDSTIVPPASDTPAVVQPDVDAPR